MNGIDCQVDRIDRSTKRGAASIDKFKCANVRADSTTHPNVAGGVDGQIGSCPPGCARDTRDIDGTTATAANAQVGAVSQDHGTERHHGSHGRARKD